MPRTIGAILDQQQVLDSISFDVVAERKTARNRQVTSHALETGATISDHVIDDNITISFRAEIGNIDLTRQYSITEKANDAYERLLSLYDDRSLVDYQTGFQLFENMLITVLEISETPGKPGALLADIVLEQLDITESEQVLIPQSILLETKTKKQLSSEVNRGKQDLSDAGTQIPVQTLSFI